MKKCQMEWKSNTESVIGRLMGLEQLRPRQHLGKTRSVLSDRYKYKVAAITGHYGSLVSTGTKNVDVDAMKDVLGIVALASKDDVMIIEPTNASVTKSLDDIHKKSEDCLVMNGSDELTKFGSEIVVKPSIIEQELEKVTCGYKDGKFGMHSKSVYEENNVENAVTNCIGCARNMNRLSYKLPSGRKFDDVSIPGCMKKGHELHLSLNVQTPRTQRFGRWTRTKVARRIEFSERTESCRRVDVLEPEVGNGCNQFKTSTVGNNAMWESLNISNQDSEDEMNIGSAYDKSLATVNEFSEELSTYSNSSRIGTPEYQENPKRIDQHSPDSVLRPFYGEHYSTDQCFGSIDFQLQLQVLNLETEDSCSEGSFMGVSGDEDSDDQLSDLPRHGRKVRTWLGDEESQNFSYMVDLLDKAGFYGTKSCSDFNTWHSPESPISHAVFEALEEKYGKQTSWQKSDRQLLFNYINFRLMGIFNPLMTLGSSLKGALLANMTRDEIEDQLWTMLIMEEKEKDKVLSGKALEEWFEADEGMDIVYNELATELFDELVAELVS